MNFHTLGIVSKLHGVDQSPRSGSRCELLRVMFQFIKHNLGFVCNVKEMFNIKILVCAQAGRILNQY